MRGEPVINPISAKKISAIVFTMLRALPICKMLAAFFLPCKFTEIM